MKKFMSLLLVVGLVLCSVRRVALGQQRLADPVDKIKTDVANRLRRDQTHVTVRLRNGSELKGRITQAAENMFTLREKSTGALADTRARFEVSPEQLQKLASQFAHTCASGDLKALVSALA